MLCDEVMKKNVVKIGLAESARTAAELMRTGNLGFLPVTDEQGRAVGTITDRDLAIRVLADALDPSTSISTVMTKEVVSCKPTDDIETARHLMESYHKSRIVVSDDSGEVRGIISLSDLAILAPTQQSGDTLRRVAEREARPS